MSLILEALKKVERERATPEQRGFLVLGPAAWAPSRSNLAWVLGMIGAAAVAGGSVYVLTRPEASAIHEMPRPEARVAPGPASAPLAKRADVPPAADGWPEPQSSAPRTRPTASDPAPAGSAAVPDPTPPGPVLMLHAISEQGGAPIAVINERVVREGDRFDGVRILRIGAAEVEVEVKGARRTLRF